MGGEDPPYLLLSKVWRGFGNMLFIFLGKEVPANSHDKKGLFKYWWRNTLSSNALLAVGSLTLGSFKRSLVLEGKKTVLQNYCCQKLQTDLTSRSDVSLLTNTSCLASEVIPLSLLSQQPRTVLGASSFCGTGISSSVPCGHCYAWFRTKYKTHFFSQSWLYWADQLKLSPQKQYFKNRIEMDCIIFLQHNLQTSFLENNEINFFSFQFYTDPDSPSCFYPITHYWKDAERQSKSIESG